MSGVVVGLLLWSGSDMSLGRYGDMSRDFVSLEIRFEVRE